MGIFETILVVINMHVGFNLMGANDIGGAIFVHTFGAYFGLAVSFCFRKKKLEKSELNEGTRYTSDITSLLGKIIMLQRILIWPDIQLMFFPDTGYRAE